MTETARALTCPQCGGTIALRAAGASVTLVCEHCGSALDATREDVRVITAAAEAMARPEIALGTRGTIDGTQWEVVGFLQRTDDWVNWSEYLLFNPYEGYAFLVDDGRRFSLGRLMDATPDDDFRGMVVGDALYRRFGDTYQARVTFVVGEFYWRVAVGEEVAVDDYVRPGAMLSYEANAGEGTWTHLRLLDMGVAERAFGAEKRHRQANETPAPHEPSPYGRLLKEALLILAAALVAMIVISLGRGGSATLITASLNPQMDGSAGNAVLGPIKLTEPYSVVTIRAEARTLNNAWVELDYSLVDTATQASFDAATSAEYYQGRDSDGNWAEGNWTPQVSLASVPAGTYELVVEATAKRWVPFTDPSYYSGTPPSAGEQVPVEIRVRRGGSFGGNIPLALALMAIWPGILLLLHYSFHKRRMAPVTDD